LAAPRVTFYVLPEAGERAWLVYACRLVEKAYLLEHPHGLAGGAQAACVPVLISAADQDALPADLLVNLGREVPPDFHRYGRVAEVVDGDGTRRQAGRERFRFYRDQGIEPETYTVGQP
jgi:DNA polymerase IIIc chi subunit